MTNGENVDFGRGYRRWAFGGAEATNVGRERMKQTAEASSRPIEGDAEEPKENETRIKGTLDVQVVGASWSGDLVENRPM